jgi:putative transposase
LAPTMAATDVEETLTLALDLAGVEQVRVQHHPRLLSDNGPAFIAEALAEFLKPYDIQQIHGRAHHPQTQGKIERYHRSMKSIILLNTFYFPWELEQAIADFVAYYNHQRYHESLDNVTPADVFFGRQEEVLTQRHIIKQKTLLERRNLNLHAALPIVQ